MAGFGQTVIISPITMLPAQRREAILRLLSRRQQLRVGDLAAELNASHETIRRDLAALDARHLLRRVHGGAIAVQAGQEDAFTRRARQLRAEKERIGVRAAALFTAGDSLFIDAGTTTVAFALALARKSGLTVITNCIGVAAHLWRGPGANRIHLLGGEFWGEAGETLGAETVRQASPLHPDHAVLTVGAVDGERGFMDFNLDEAMVARAMVRNARSVTVLADHSKFGRTALASVCALAEAARVVTDRAPPAAVAAALSEAGVEILVG